MTTGKEFGKRLAQLRREKGVREHRDIQQLDVAKAVGVSNATVSRWESGIDIPREKRLAKLAAYLNVTPAYLRYGIRDPVTLQPHPMEDAMEALTKDKQKAPPKQGRNGGGKRSA